MDTPILRKLLKYEFYKNHQHRLTDKLFAKEHRDLFITIISAHEKHTTDISITELRVLFENHFPVATNAYKNAVAECISKVEMCEEISDQIGSDIIGSLWQRHVNTRIADLAIQASEGHDGAWEKLVSIVEENRSGFETEDNLEFTTDDIEVLLARASDKSRWKFNLRNLHEKVYGIGPKEFASVFATPNVGKTALMLSLCFAPDGFAHQGAKIFYVVNEEASERTKLRAYQCNAGMTVEECEKDPTRVATEWSKIKDNVFFKDIQEITLGELDRYCKAVAPDHLIIDQADKINIIGNFGASHERLRELYRKLRELAKAHNCVVWAMSQASNDARGKTMVSPFDMEGSKIGKSAELDLILGVGALEQTDASCEPDYTRWITVGKNKLNGFHGMIPAVYLDHKISRYRN